MSKFKQLINPHQHSDGSLDGAATVSQIVDRSIELGATHVAVTEHGNMNTNMSMYHTCKKKGIIPILGCELYLANPFEKELREAFEKELDEPDLEKREKKINTALKGEYVHLTVHFKDQWAYEYFCSLTPKMEERAIVRWGERKPIITLEELSGAAGHITICSSCLVGAVQKWLLPSGGVKFLQKTKKYNSFNDPEKAERAYLMLREIAGKDSFFIEVFPHEITHNWKSPVRNKETNRIIQPGSFEPVECSPVILDGDLQKAANKFIVGLAEKYNDPVIISLDSHFATPEQKIIQDAKLGNGAENWKFYNSLHIMSSDEAAVSLKHTLGVNDKTIEKWIDNSYMFASQFNNFHIPTSDDRWILREFQGDFSKELKKRIDRHGRMNWANPEMVKQLKIEIDILAYNGKINLLSYLFTCEDAANWCRENHVLMNVRGSAGGSLLLYVLGVSAINPLKHDLSFGRFITPGRIEANTLPDVDMDLSHQDKFIDYLNDTYGDSVCRISTDMVLKLKSSIKDAERAVLGKVRPETEKLCSKSIPQTPQGANDQEWVFGYEDDTGTHVNGIIDTNKDLKAYADANPEIWKTVHEMIGIMRNKSTHACGFVIADKPVQDYVPVTIVSKQRVTGYSPKTLEMAGLVKFDFLGLNTLKDIQGAVDSIKERTGDIINPFDLPHDKVSFDNFALGNTISVFQFGTATVIPYLKAIKPKNIDDLAAVTALCRPGTLDAPSSDDRTLAEVFVDRANGEAIQYVHPDLEPIFKETYGIALYQEQTMRIFTEIVGYSDAEADAVRRGIGKKIEKVLKECMADLKRVCLGKGWTMAQVELLIKQIMASSNYSFNKSHATAYAYNAYACMWLKTNYPLDWWKSVMSNADKNEIVVKFWKYVKDFTELPSINESGEDYIIKGDKLISPLSVVNGVGPKAYAQLRKYAPYKDLHEFVHTHFRKRKRAEGRSAVNKGIAIRLIAAGLLDELFTIKGEDDAPGINEIQGKDLDTQEKIYLFNKTRAEIRKEKIDPVGEEYIKMSKLGQYMARKQLVKMYSKDLRPLMLPTRGAVPVKNGAYWQINMEIFGKQKKVSIVGHERFDATCNSIEAKEFPKGSNYTFAVLAYVIDEKTFTYKNKTKQATKIWIDVDGAIKEEVIWPSKDAAVADSDYKDIPVLIVYNIAGPDKLRLSKIVRLIDKTKIKQYNVT